MLKPITITSVQGHLWKRLAFHIQSYPTSCVEKCQKERYVNEQSISSSNPKAYLGSMKRYNK